MLKNAESLETPRKLKSLDKSCKLTVLFGVTFTLLYFCVNPSIETVSSSMKCEIVKRILVIDQKFFPMCALNLTTLKFCYSKFG